VIIAYAPDYVVELGPHVFPTVKYRLVRSRLLESGVVDEAAFRTPERASWDDLALVHTAQYLRKVRTGAFSLTELVRLEIPWSPAIVDGFRAMTGGTILAARAALEEGIAVNLGGGFHHAFPDHGEGFCLFNDVAVAIRRLQQDGRISRAAVLDCDVHHGNGTAAIFAADPRVFTCSLHQEHNYPAVKPRSGLDVGLEDGADDETYLRALDEALAAVFEHRPEMVFYLAGADPFVDDQLGGLALTRAGLRERDRRVLGRAREARVPTVVLLAGGYARRLDDTVALHVATVEEACRAASALATSR
jgi:acetoin utilization deacetylase AcuC-like enzyme